MIVVIEEEVFSSPDTQQTQIISLLQLGFEGRHRVQVDPVFDPKADGALHRWLEAQSSGLQEEAALALRAGLEEAVHGIPSDRQIRVSATSPPDWRSEPPRLPLATAEPLLRRPLKVVLESRRHDGAFLLAVALEPWRAQLKKEEQLGHLERVHGGGLTEMNRMVDELAQPEAERLFHWLMFDSDALEPGQPSAQSEALRSACQSKGLGHHQLQRRASENYLPPQAIHAWAYSVSGDAQRRRARKARAFGAMNSRQRSHFNMKKGFQGDESREIPTLFDRLPEHPELREGFGSNIARLYLEESFSLQDDWFVRDNQIDETRQFIQAIFRAL